MLALLLSQPFLLLGAFIAGMCFKRMIVDKIKAYIVKKMAPGIIQNYLEGMLGLNQDVLPPVQVIALPVPVVAAPIVDIPVAPPVQ